MSDDLGFDFQTRKGGDVQILHHGRLATTLRGQRATDFLADMDDCDFDEQQQIMARLTGNYKRGNERVAKNHPRNRR
ncbi:hypothetical protein [Maritalea sp. S77]|uniref:hypothetical protein n=1 Tax=Maritalea sp. S77 TaxID=3415125 RepID=UPI003C7B4E94